MEDMRRVFRSLSLSDSNDDDDLNVAQFYQALINAARPRGPFLGGGGPFGGSRPSSTVYAASFSMGYMASEDRFVQEWSTQTDVRFNYNYNTRLVNIYFGYAGRKYKVEFKLKALGNNGEIVVEEFDTSGNRAAFTMMLKHPGRFWQERSRTAGRKESTWYRVLDLDKDYCRGNTWDSDYYYDEVLSSPLPSSFKGTSATATPLGKWTTYQVTFELNVYTHQKARVCYKTLMNKIVEHKAIPRGPITPGVKIHVERHLQSLTRTPTDVSSSRSTLTTPTIATTLSSAASQGSQLIDHDERSRRISHFEAFYTLESFISSYRLNENTLSEAFYTTLCRLPPFVAIDALKVMCFKEDERVWNPLERLQELVQKQSTLGLGHLHVRRRRKSHIVFVYKAMMTPTACVLELPQPEMSNRVIREFKRYDDRFLRVTFVEEGLGMLVNTASTRQFISDQLFVRILDTIRHGIRIGDRHYEFLAFSSSQLRTHGCWFFSATTMEEDGSVLDANRIRQWMGNFQNERVVAKHAARMGQCFSSTHEVAELTPHQITRIADVTNNGFTFSDGVGRIAPDLAELVAKKMNRSRVPSAFQIRLGGAKGVLTVHAQENDLMQPGTIALRPSQIKFETEHQKLEINHTAKYACAHLNRQLISILSSLNVPDSVFLDILEGMINDVDKMLTDPLQASRVLRETSDGLGIQRSMAKIVEAGFLQRRDPYIKNLLEAFRVARLKEARKKARIPLTQGVFLMGVLDETNTLKENQIFCQFIDANNGNTNGPLTGECLVYRSPCLHPGDVRVLEAVDIPELRDLYNVVVFPAQNGDCYSVIWDKRLFPPLEYQNIIPMSYTAPRPLTLSDQVTIAHIQEFFVSFIKSSNLGQIANAHLARADKSPDGVFDPGCIKLAEYHSMAVDFAKTGVPAEPDPNLLTMPGNKYPDFMEKKDKPSYESQKALGKMYRRIGHIKYREYRDMLWDVNTDGVYYDARIQVPGMECYIGEARRLKRYYDRDLRDLMGRLGVNSEAEIMSGWIIKWMHKRRNEKLFEVQHQARKDMMRMKMRWFHAEFSTSRNIAMKKDDLEAKAAAWYYVAYHPHEQKRQRDEGKQFDKRYTHDEELLSFPWVAQDLLCELAKKRMGVNNTRNAYPTFSEDVIAMYDPGEPPSDEEDDYSESDYGSEYEP